eukprot:scaffold644_cov32-Attheya_sp.AAC.3
MGVSGVHVVFGRGGVAGYDQDSADLPPPFSLSRELTNHVQQHHDGHPTRSKRNKKADWIINLPSWLQLLKIVCCGRQKKGARRKEAARA